MADRRRIEVPASRIVPWVSGFARRHGKTTWHPDAATLRLEAADGSTAELVPFLPDLAVIPTDPQTLTSWTAPANRTVAVVLIRRGGYAVGLARGGAYLATKVGSRYVQSRTAAGGWSQQRYQRRRTNQADQLVDAAAGHLARLAAEQQVTRVDAVVTGGDGPLSASVLSDRRLDRLIGQPVRHLSGVPDPRRETLDSVLDRARGAEIHMVDLGKPWP